MGWSETGMSHPPGTQPADVDEPPAHGAAATALSQSVDKRLQIDPATLENLERQPVEVHMAGTREAVQTYNEFASTVPVAGLFRSTC